MNHATLQHALTAMRAGRLDEAANLLTAPKVRPHRAAQEALTRVCRCLVERGRKHLSAERWVEARQDTARVLAIEPGHAEAADLLAQVTRQAVAKKQQAGRVAEGLAYARRLADLGQSSRARAAVNDLDNSAGRRFVADLDLQKLERQALLERGEAALARDDFVAAAHTLDRLAALPPSPAVETFRHTLRNRATLAADAHLEAGRLDEARALLQRTAASDALTGLCDDLCVAAEELARGDAAAALPRFRRAAIQLPHADWLQDVIEKALHLRETQEALAAGPLGTLADTRNSPCPASSQAATRAVGWKADSPNPSPLSAVADPVLPHAPLILHQDGQPLAILCASPRVNLTGPDRGDDLGGLPLLTSGAGLSVTLSRDEEGHLVHAPGSLTVNQQPATTALLVDQDRIGLGPRLRLRYQRANAASQTAVLELTAGRFATPHLRRIVLLAGELLVGPHRGCHLRDPKLEQPVTFRPSADGLMVDGVTLTADGPSQIINGQTWSVSRLQTHLV